METHTKKERIERWKRYNNGSSSTLINDKLLKFNRTSFHLSPRCVLLTAQTSKRKNNNKKLTNFVHCLALCKRCVHIKLHDDAAACSHSSPHPDGLIKNTHVVSFFSLHHKKGNVIIIKQKDIDQEYISCICAFNDAFILHPLPSTLFDFCLISEQRAFRRKMVRIEKTKKNFMHVRKIFRSCVWQKSMWCFPLKK